MAWVMNISPPSTCVVYAGHYVSVFSLLPFFDLSLFAGQVISILDLTRTWPANVEWKVKGPKTNHRHQLIESISGSGGGQSIQLMAKYVWNL